jgi:rhodanese-related sulfurtransferase
MNEKQKSAKTSTGSVRLCTERRPARPLSQPGDGRDRSGESGRVSAALASPALPRATRADLLASKALTLRQGEARQACLPGDDQEVSRMKLFVLSLAAVLTLGVPAAAVACGGDKATSAKAEIKKVSVPELVTLRQQNDVKVVDVNSPKTRSEQGIIPGAALLTSSSQYDPATELPGSKDSKLVFYCANTRCTAAETAARRAAQAGYRDVSVLPDGIAGWRAAGEPTETPRS